MREVWRSGLCIVLFGGICLLAPRAYRADFYVTTGILVLLGLGTAVTMLAHVSRLSRREIRIETAIPRVSDLDAIRGKALLDHAPVILLYRSADGVIHVANRAARRLFSTNDCLRPEQSVALETEDRLVRLTPCAGGAPGIYFLSTVRTSGSGGIRQLLVLTDIETELNEADARTLRDLLSVLSHEIMNSLTPIVSLAETAHDLASRPDAAQSREMLAEALDTILRRARGIDRFVQGYRALARLPPPERKPTRLAELLATVVALFETRWGEHVRLKVNFPPSHLTARLDAEQIEQALLNLLNNAADAALERTHDIVPTVWLEAMGTSEKTVFAVRDNGVGVAEADRDSIFQPFFTLKRNGSGIGLTLTRQIALAHGGSLTLELGELTASWKTSFILTL